MDVLTTFAVIFSLAALRYMPVMVLPGLSPLAWAPAFVRIVLMLAFAWLTVLSLPDLAWTQVPAWPMGVLLAALGELLVGMIFGLAFLLPNGAIHSAGWLIDMQAGLGAASLFNPANDSTSESLLGHALMLAATVLFFSLDLHLQLFKGVAASQRWLPLGQTGLHIGLEGFMSMVGRSFTAGMTVVAPVVLGLFFVDVAVGYASRSMPQANIYFLALPLKVAVALGLLAATLSYMPLLMGRVFDDAAARVPATLKGP